MLNKDPPDKDHSEDDLSRPGANNTQQLPSQCINWINRIREINWRSAMNPFTLHSKQEPDCSPVLSIISSSLSNGSSLSSSTTAVRNTPIKNEPENPSKRRKIETIDSESSSSPSIESDLFQQARRHTFSHWPHRTMPSSAQMIEAGFFYCNVGDRVICLHCNLICQQWTPHTDDPCEVHKTLSPNCIYVQTKLNSLRFNEIVFTAACNPAYAELPKRHASFATWPHENLPSVDDLVRAGFFYTGTKTIVTCFYCNGSLQNWGANDNPMIEHARWFPHCAYAKQLCGDELYRKIQESKRAQQECARANESSENVSCGVKSNPNVTTNSRQLLIPDESTLSRLVAARLDLPISQRLLYQNFKLSIIKRCWEDQLRLKQEDFVSECDLLVACLILQKQIEHIDGKKENIVIPRLRMKYFHEGEGKERKATNFTEERLKTIEREKLFHHWPHSLPSRRDMITSGWLLDKTKGNDFTTCPYCGVECNNWEPNDNPLRIHRGWSPLCPYILSSHPMHPSSVSIRPLGDVFTPEKIAIEAAQSVPNVILISNSPYARPSKREKSFSAFPGGPPPNVDALVRSGFYYDGIHTLLRCYDCGRAVNDFHQHPSNEINARHHQRFSHCGLAQSLVEQDKKRSTGDADVCKWCSTDSKELAISPCMHLAVCRSCAQLINTCPICGVVAEAFMRIYM